MGQLTDTISYFFRYIFQTLPEARRQEDIISIQQRLCTPVPIYKKEAIHDERHPIQLETKKLCCLLFSLFPHTDMKGFLSFILSLFAIDDVLESHRKRKDVRDEHEIRNLLSCLSSSVDPSKNITCGMADSIKSSLKAANETDETSRERVLLKCNADQCKLQLAVLPSYNRVAFRIKKYMQLYTDLQSYRHYPSIISIEVLRSWSGDHIKHYRDISCWEFCAAADTFLGIAAMYAAASIPDITDDEIRLLDEACFPWLCGLVSLLGSAISARSAIGTEEFNFSSFYSNLKECENRIMFFATQAEAACMKLRDSSLYIHAIKAMMALYLSDPETNFSMLRLTAANITKGFSLNTYKNIIILLRCLNLL